MQTLPEDSSPSYESTPYGCEFLSLPHLPTTHGADASSFILDSSHNDQVPTTQLLQLSSHTAAFVTGANAAQRWPTHVPSQWSCLKAPSGGAWQQQVQQQGQQHGQQHGQQQGQQQLNVLSLHSIGQAAAAAAASAVAAEAAASAVASAQPNAALYHLSHQQLQQQLLPVAGGLDLGLLSEPAADEMVDVDMHMLIGHFLPEALTSAQSNTPKGALKPPSVGLIGTAGAAGAGAAFGKPWAASEGNADAGMLMSAALLLPSSPQQRRRSVSTEAAARRPHAQQPAADSAAAAVKGRSRKLSARAMEAAASAAAAQAVLLPLDSGSSDNEGAAVAPAAAARSGSKRSSSSRSIATNSSSGSSSESESEEEEEEEEQQGRQRRRAAKCPKRVALSRAASGGSSGSADAGAAAATAATAAGKSPPPKGPTSSYKGVTKHRWTGKWEGHLWDPTAPRKTKGSGRTRGKQVYLGGYDCELEAARAYDRAALTYFGEEAVLNFPLSDYSQDLPTLLALDRTEAVAALRRRSSGFARGASKHRGVTRHHSGDKFESRIGRIRNADNKYLYLGVFESEEAAARAYDVAALQHRGPRAITNFPITDYLDPETNHMREEFGGGMPGSGSKGSRSSPAKTAAAGKAAADAAAAAAGAAGAVASPAASSASEMAVAAAGRTMGDGRSGDVAKVQRSKRLAPGDIGVLQGIGQQGLQQQWQQQLQVQQPWQQLQGLQGGLPPISTTRSAPGHYSGPGSPVLVMPYEGMSVVPSLFMGDGGGDSILCSPAGHGIGAAAVIGAGAAVPFSVAAWEAAGGVRADGVAAAAVSGAGGAPFGDVAWSGEAAGGAEGVAGGGDVAMGEGMCEGAVDGVGFGALWDECGSD